MGRLNDMLWLLARRIEAETASIRVGVALRSLEQHYRQDQPRVPAGSPEGGQWTEISDTGRRTQVAFAARLVDQRVGIGDDKLIRMCTYLDMLGRQLSKELDASEPCPPTLRAKPYYGSV